MRLILLLGINFMAFASSFCQSFKGENYVLKYKNIAIQEMQRTGVPAAITLAQGMLESGYGESKLSKSSNNHFGIKCKLDWEGEKTYQDDDYKAECFRVYNNASESYRDHSNFLKSRSWYAPLFTLPPTDYKAWAYGLKKAGYATQSDYAERLIFLIEKYNLQIYTLEGLDEVAALQTNAPEPPKPPVKRGLDNQPNIAFTPTTQSQPVNTTASINQNLKPTEPNPALDSAVYEEVVEINTPQENLLPTSALILDFSEIIINSKKAIIAKKGTALLALAMKYNIMLEKLLAYNELEKIDILPEDQILFLEKKAKKGMGAYYVIKENDSLYSISQGQGIQLSYLLSYNNFSSKNIKLNEGETILLQP